MTLFPLPGFMKPKGPAYCPEYLAVYNAFTNKPSAADAVIQNAKMLAIVAGGRYAKSERHWEFSVHTNTAGEAQLDWIDPVNHLPVTNVNGCAWDAYNGFTGQNAGGKCIRTNFIPSVNGIMINKDNMCLIIGSGTDYASGIESNTIVGAYSGVTPGSGFSISPHSSGNTAYTKANHNVQDWSSPPNGNRKYLALSRGLSTEYDYYYNSGKHHIITNSTYLVTRELYGCGVNTSGVITARDTTLRYMTILTYLIEAEVQLAMTDEETYLDNYGTGLIP
jgi:hypothetical protein